MTLPKCSELARAAAIWGVAAAAIMLTLGAAQAQAPMVMKFSSPTIHDVPDTFSANLGAQLEKESNGRIKSENYPASQLGSIPRQIEGTQFGAIQCVVVPPEFMVGLDERFGVLAAPGLISSTEQGQRLAADPEVLKLMLGLGAAKGLHGIALMMAEPQVLVSRMPIRHLADLKGKKIRIFASQFQSVAFERFGVTPVAMSLGDVLPALQQGAIDGSIGGTGPFTNMHFIDAAKYITMINQPAIFIIADVNQKWFDALPADLQQMIQKDATQQAVAINSFAEGLRKKSEAAWKASGGELITLPPDEQATFLSTLQSVGSDVSKSKPELAAAYQVVTAAAARVK